MREPSVGIFWKLLPDLCQGSDGIVSYSTGLSVAEPYGDFLTCPVGHYELWEKWRKESHRGPNAPDGSALANDYEDFPRGRVVYHRPTQTFWVYADPLLQTRPMLRAIALRFNLAEQRIVVKSDDHYTTRGGRC